jgi:hypothetical protein
MRSHALRLICLSENDTAFCRAVIVRKSRQEAVGGNYFRLSTKPRLSQSLFGSPALA